MRLVFGWKCKRNVFDRLTLRLAASGCMLAKCAENPPALTNIFYPNKLKRLVLSLMNGHPAHCTFISPERLAGHSRL